MRFKWFTYAMVLAGAFFLASQVSVAQGKGKGKKKAAKKAQVDGKGKKGAKAADGAKEEAPPQMKDPKAMAKESYNNGKKYYKSEDYDKALESFMAAYNYSPNPFVYISIAQCYDKQGKCQEARDYYKKYMEEKPDAGNIPDVKEKIAELESRKGKVSILSDPAGATVTIDGETVAMVTPGSVDLQGGDHALALNLDGYIMETRAFTVPICSDVEISVKLKSAGSVTSITTDENIEEAIKAVEKEKKPRRKISLGVPHYVSFGLAGAALITAAVTGGLALQKSNDFADKKDEYETTGDPGLYDDMKDLKSSGRSLAIACDVTIGVAAVAAVAGIALLFLVPKEKKKVAVTPLFSSKGGGASLSLNF
ncbi:MAG: PEGA domain-containing protein [Pseudomonadota bacterium]